MQPEQQNDQTPNQLPYQVPDYLQLDPVTGQPQKSSKKLKLIFIVAIIVIIVGGLGGALFVWAQGAMERNFYAAINSTLSVNYVTRTFNSTSPTNTTSAKVTSDLTDPASPKSRFDYTFSQSVIGNQPGAAIAIKGSEVVTANNLFFGRLSDTYSDSSEKPTLNKWVKIPDSDTTSVGMYDPFNFHTILNTFSGVVLIGNFNQDDRNQLVGFMQSNRVYSIQSSRQTSTDNNTPATEYTITIDEQKLMDLNKKAANLLGVDLLYDISADGVSGKVYKLLVDNSTNKLTKITFNSKDQDAKNATSGTIDFSYPQKVNIDVPEL
jgi:hypothetical protein